MTGGRLRCLWFAGLAGVVLLLLLGTWHWPRLILTVRLPRLEYQILKAVPVVPGERIQLSYRHSVEGTKVQGLFEVTANGTLAILETRMDSVGTGLPNLAPGRSHRQGEYRVVDEGRRSLEDLRFFWSPFTSPDLRVGDKLLDLGRTRAGSLLLIKPEHINLGRYLLWRAMSYPWPPPGEGL